MLAVRYDPYMGR